MVMKKKNRSYWKKLIEEWELRFPQWKVYSFNPNLVVARNIGDRWITLDADLAEDILEKFEYELSLTSDGADKLELE